MTVELLHIDCMEYMASVPDKAFDLAIVDPPYGIGVARFGKMSSSSCKEYTKKNWDDLVPSDKYFKELRRVAKHQIIWGSNYYDGVGLAGGGIVWNKLGTRVGYHLPLPGLSDCEFAYCSIRNNIKMFSYTQIGNVYGNNYQIDFKQQRIHPTQKPVQLYQWLLKNYAKPGQKILDTHLGSGSSAIAAHYFGVDFVGCELDEDYFRLAKRRFEMATAQTTIFDFDEG